MQQQAEKNLTRLAVDKRTYQLSPRETAFIDDCKEKYLPNGFIFSAWNVFSFENTSGSANPFLGMFKEMTWTFIVTIIMGFLVLLFTFDSISGEKESGTLSLALSNSFSRGTLLFSKWAAAIVTMMIMLIIGVIVSLLIVIISGQVQFTTQLLVEVTGFVIFGLFFLASMAAFGLLTSVLTHNSNISLLISLSIWLLFSVIIPNSTTFAAKRLFSIDHEEVIQERIEQIFDDLDKNAPEGSWYYNGTNLFQPEHELRAALQMKRFSAQKQIRDAYHNDMFHQFNRTRLLSVISPICSFEYLTESAIGGGYARFKKVWEDLHVYQSQFLQFFKDRDMADEESPHWYNPFEDCSTSRKPVNFSEVPQFSEQLMSLGERLASSVKYVLMNILYCGGVFFISFVIFVRYDVR